MPLFGSALPDFPWDSLVPDRKRAAEHPGGSLDLTIGTPVDDVPELAQRALAEASNAHGYPTVLGTPALQQAIRGWLSRRRSVTSNIGAIPTVGSKEMVALLPAFLGLGEGQRVGFPLAAYPTYDVGARLAGAQPVPIDTDADPESWPVVDLMWINSPGNPNGHVHSRDDLRKIVAWARANGVTIASDECYGELPWDVAEAPSILADDVCDSDPTRLLVLYSLSKQSNLAGYRAAFIAGDPAILADLLEVRKHSGFMVPGPIQHAMAVMLDDDDHVATQREVYRARRNKLLSVLDAAGLVNDPDSVAGLYLWVEDTGGADAWAITHACAELGIVVAPGTFYGDAGANRVRISLTAKDETIDAAVLRLTELPEALKAFR